MSADLALTRRSSTTIKHRHSAHSSCDRILLATGNCLLSYVWHQAQCHCIWQIEGLAWLSSIKGLHFWSVMASNSYHFQLFTRKQTHQRYLICTPNSPLLFWVSLPWSLLKCRLETVSFMVTVIGLHWFFLGTYYETGLGACGIYNTDSDFIAAASASYFDNFPGATANPNE
jgi:hypothetical protein